MPESRVLREPQTANLSWGSKPDFADPKPRSVCMHARAHPSGVGIDPRRLGAHRALRRRECSRATAGFVARLVCLLSGLKRWKSKAAALGDPQREQKDWKGAGGGLERG